MAPHLNDSPYCLLPLCKKLETCNDWKMRKCPKTPILTLNPRVKIIFQNFSHVTFFTLLPVTSCEVSEKTNEWSLRYLKTGGHTDGHTDGHHTDGQGRLLRTPTGKSRVHNRGANFNGNKVVT